MRHAFQNCATCDGLSRRFRRPDSPLGSHAVGRPRGVTAESSTRRPSLIGALGHLRGTAAERDSGPAAHDLLSLKGWDWFASLDGSSSGRGAGLRDEPRVASLGRPRWASLSHRHAAWRSRPTHRNDFTGAPKTPQKSPSRLAESRLGRSTRTGIQATSMMSAKKVSPSATGE